MRRIVSSLGIPLTLLLGLSSAPPVLAAPAQRLPAPALSQASARGETASTTDPLETAVFAGGCFWGVQAVFAHVRGVRSVVAGYAGGAAATAHYHMVSTGTTGHAESVAIRFDPRAISYGELLRIFFSVVHDPTELDRQGPDTGKQYRSEIFYVDDAQAAVARAYIGQLERAHLFRHPIVTRVEPLKGFYPAETVHQDFVLRYPDSPYVVENDLPKIRDLGALFPEDYRQQPLAVSDVPIAVSVDGSAR